MKKSNKKAQRKKRKNETTKKNKGNKMATLENLTNKKGQPTLEEKREQLQVNLMQINQAKEQASVAYAQNFVGLFNALALEFFKSGVENPVGEAKDATESIRLATADYSQFLMAEAPQDERYETAEAQINMQLAAIEEETTVATVTAIEDVEVSADTTDAEDVGATPAPTEVEEASKIVPSSPSALAKE